MFSASGLAEFFKNVQAWIGLIPALIAAFDTAFGFLPVSSALKPWIYVLLFIFIVFALLAETSRYVSIKGDSGAVTRRRKATKSILLVGVIFAAIYYGATKSENAWRPDSPVLLYLSLFLVCVCFAFAFERITRALLILGLYFPRQNPPELQDTSLGS